MHHGVRKIRKALAKNIIFFLNAELNHLEVFLFKLTGFVGKNL